MDTPILIYVQFPEGAFLAAPVVARFDFVKACHFSLEDSFSLFFSKYQILNTWSPELALFLNFDSTNHISGDGTNSKTFLILTIYFLIFDLIKKIKVIFPRSIVFPNV